MAKIKKIALIVISTFLAIIVAGAIVFGVTGFNYDESVVGCVEIKIELDEYAFSDEKREYFRDEIKDIVENEFTLVNEPRIEDESGTYATLVYNIKGNYKTLYFLDDARDSGFEYNLVTFFTQEGIDFDYAESFKVDRVGGTYSKNVIISSAIAIGVIALATCIYFAFRFGFASALLSFVSIILELAVLLTMVAITRIPVGAQSVIAMWATLIVSLICSLIYNSLVRAEKKSVEEGTWEERCDRANCKSGKIIFRTLVAMIACLIVAVAFVPAKIKITLSLIALALLIIGVNAILVKPVLRCWMGKLKKEKKSGYALHAKQKETKV